MGLQPLITNVRGETVAPEGPGIALVTAKREALAPPGRVRSARGGRQARRGEERRPLVFAALEPQKIGGETKLVKGPEPLRRRAPVQSHPNKIPALRDPGLANHIHRGNRRG